jgi:hypothetical protein
MAHSHLDTTPDELAKPFQNQFTIIFYEDGQSKKQVITLDDIETRIQKATNLQVQLTNIQDAISKAG